MNPERLTEYLHSQIPLSVAMSVKVVSASIDEVVLAAPLAPNINHKRTMFGGSGASVLTLAAWMLLTVRLGGQGSSFEIVIADGCTSFYKPVEGDFQAIARSTGVDWDHFHESLERRGKGRIQLRSEIVYEGVVCASFVGQFVAVSREVCSSTLPPSHPKTRNSA